MSARRLLQLLVLVQALAAAGLAWALWRSGLHPGAALALAAALVVLVRLLISANNFRMSSRAASPTPAGFRLGRAGAARLFAGEFRASMLQSSWFMPRARPCSRIFPGATLPPVLLLHGYGCNSGYWAQLRPLLDARRISHATVDLEPLGAPIDDYVPAVARAVDALCAAAGSAQVAIVAHSMGGLVARAYLRAHGRAKVARVVTLGTPHHGTRLAAIGIGANAAQMRRGRGAEPPESAWLQKLAAGEDAATRALVTSIFTHHDNIVSPQTSCVLPGGHNIAFGGVGHVALGSDPRILSCVLHELARHE